MLKKKYPRKPCIVDGCSLQSQIKGYCVGHYNRIVLVVNPKITKKIKYCTLDGCARKHSSKGLCKVHYNIFLEEGVLRPIGSPGISIGSSKIQRKNKELCEVYGCDNLERCKNMCSKHYQRFLRHGDTGINYQRKYRSTLITVDNVLRPHMANFTTADEKEALGEIFWDNSDIRESSDIYY